jgi:hypothetical protein
MIVHILIAMVAKSVHMRLVHSRSNHSVFLGGDLLKGRGDRRLIVEG